MAVGIAGKPFSKVQVAIGIIQFCIAWALIGYLVALGWSGYIIWKNLTAPRAAQGGQGGQNIAPVIGQFVNLNPFENKAQPF